MRTKLFTEEVSLANFGSVELNRNEEIESTLFVAYCPVDTFSVVVESDDTLYEYNSDNCEKRYDPGMMLYEFKSSATNSFTGRIIAQNSNASSFFLNAKKHYYG